MSSQLSAFFIGAKQFLGLHRNPNDTPLGINHSFFSRLFQIDIDTLYTDINEPTVDTDEVRCVLIGCDYIGIPVEEHFEEPENVKITRVRTAFREDVCYATLMEYVHTEIEKGDTEYIVLQIAEAAPNEGSLAITPHFTLYGYYTLGQGGLATLVPTAITCAKFLNGELINLGVKTAEEIYCALAYANSAFLQLVSGVPIDISQNEKWLEPEMQEQALDLCNKIAGRLFHNFEDDVRRLREGFQP